MRGCKQYIFHNHHPPCYSRRRDAVLEERDAEGGFRRKVEKFRKQHPIEFPGELRKVAGTFFVSPPTLQAEMLLITSTLLVSDHFSYTFYWHFLCWFWDFFFQRHKTPLPPFPIPQTASRGLININRSLYQHSYSYPHNFPCPFWES